MLLKPDRTGRFDRLDREPVTAPVREEAGTGQSLEPDKNRSKPLWTGSNRRNRWTGDGFDKPAGRAFGLTKKIVCILFFYFLQDPFFFNIFLSYYFFSFQRKNSQNSPESKLIFSFILKIIEIQFFYLIVSLPISLLVRVS
jgi:hypothetical protein